MKAVKVWEGPLVIPTYETGEENENPDLAVEGNLRMYPYTRRLHLKGTKKDKTYRAVFIENEFLKVIVLPELGGRVYSCEDKVTGRDIFYKNRVIKPALIQTKGTWIACGLELNFPMGHSITSYETIDSKIIKSDDGSEGVAVGNIDLVTRMRWTVLVKLYPGFSALELSVKLNNRGVLPERYYYWANAAVDATEGLHLIFPTNKLKGGEGNRINYPVHNGMDLSYYRNNKNGSEGFAHNSPEDFFGYYNEDYDFGMVHYADRHEVSGKKFFTWGSVNGLRWRKFLTDDNPPYAEFQSGPFETQLRWELLNPCGTSEFKQYYMPVRKTGGFIYANKEAAVNLVQRHSTASMDLTISANRVIKGALIIVSARGKKYYSGKRTLTPLNVFKESFPFPPNLGGKKITLSVSEGGSEILRYESVVSKLGSYEALPDLPAKKSRRLVETLYGEGVTLEKRRFFAEASKKYGEALGKDPKYAPAMLRLAVIALEKGLYRRAGELLAGIKGLNVNGANGEVCYFYGIALNRLGRMEAAKESFRELRDDSNFSAPALLELGKMSLVLGRFEEAVEILAKAWSKRANNPKVAGLYAAALRHSGKTKEAAHIVSDCLPNEPLDGLLLNEMKILGNGPGSTSALLQVLHRCRETALEIAADYMQTGLWAEAAGVIKLAKRKYPDYPLYHYYEGYALEKLGRLKEARESYRAGALAKGKRCFPWQAESVEILESAARVHPRLPNTYEYLGNFLFSRMRYDEGLKYFNKAKELGSKSPVVYRNIALGLVRLRKDYDKVARAYEQALRYNPKDWEIYAEGDKFLSIYGYKPVRKRLAKIVLEEALEHPKAMERKAKYIVDSGRYDGAIEYFSSKQFYPWEGEFLSRQIYEDAWNGKAEKLIKGNDLDEAAGCAEKAMLYPENIGVPKMDWRTESRSWFIRYMIARKRGDAAAAKEALYKIKARDEESAWWIGGEFTAYYFASERFIYHTLALSILGKSNRAEELLNKVLSKCKKDPQRMFVWASYLEGWHFLEIENRAFAAKKLLSGFTIPKAQYKFAAGIAALINKSKNAK